MTDRLSRLATRIAYATRQLPRIAWYTGHLYLMRLLAEQLRGKVKAPGRGRDPIHTSTDA
jgi:hypothetical protein